MENETISHHLLRTHTSTEHIPHVGQAGADRRDPYTNQKPLELNDTGTSYYSP